MNNIYELLVLAEYFTGASWMEHRCQLEIVFIVIKLMIWFSVGKYGDGIV